MLPGAFSRHPYLSVFLITRHFDIIFHSWILARSVTVVEDRNNSVALSTIVILAGYCSPYNVYSKLTCELETVDLTAAYHVSSARKLLSCLSELSFGAIKKLCMRISLSDFQRRSYKLFIYINSLYFSVLLLTPDLYSISFYIYYLCLNYISDFSGTLTTACNV